MPRTHRPAIAVVLTLCAMATSALLFAPAGAAQDGCPTRLAPPPAADIEQEPEPLPVPDKPVGGDQLGKCEVVLPDGAPDAPDGISAPAWLVGDLDNGDVLAARDAHGRHRPASAMKVLLSLVALRELKLDAVVAGVQEDTQQDGAKVSIAPGGEYTVRQLLQAVLIHSGNDAANALTRTLGGAPATLDKMNGLAKELGALDTRAATPSGLDGPGMSTSGYDLGLIFRAAMRNADFAEILATRKFDFPGKNPGQKSSLITDDKLLTTYQGALGGKVGSTNDAKHTYLGAAERDGHRIFVVVLRVDGKTTIFDEAKKLLDYGFALRSANARSVGSLVDKAPGQAAVSPLRDTAGPHPGPMPAAATTDNAGQYTAFGNIGMPVTIAAGLVVLAAFAMYLRDRRAKLAAQAAARAERRANRGRKPKPATTDDEPSSE